jgi:TorA maturation chaperone TorD
VTSDPGASTGPAHPILPEAPTPGLHQAWDRLGEAADRRALAWRRLSEAFYGPDAGWVEALLDGSVGEDLRLAISWLDSDQELYASSLEALHCCTHQFRDRDAAAVLEDLSVDHARLFVGPENPPASPYESVWTDVDPMTGKPIFNGPSTVAVESVYRSLGLLQAPDHGDLPDHVATEAEFLCYLCEREAAAWRSGEADQAKELRAVQQQFIEAHLGRFAREFCQAVERAGHETCYAVFADFLLAHLTVESGSPYLEVVGSIWSSPGHGR